MPEPALLSAIAGTIAVATLAYNSTKSLLAFVESIKDAPRLISILTGDIKKAQIIISDIDLLLQNRHDRSLPHDVRVCVSSACIPLEDCRAVSEEFEQRLKKWFPGSVKDRLKVNFKETQINMFGARLRDCQSALHISLTVCNIKFNGMRAEAAEKHELEMEKQFHFLTGKLEGLEISRQEILNAVESISGQNGQIALQQNGLARRLAVNERLLREAVKLCITGLAETTKVTGNKVKFAKTMEEGRQIVSVHAQGSKDISGGIEIDEMVAAGTSRQVGFTNDANFALEFLK